MFSCQSRDFSSRIFNFGRRDIYSLEAKSSLIKSCCLSCSFLQPFKILNSFVFVICGIKHKPGARGVFKDFIILKAPNGQEINTLVENDAGVKPFSMNKQLKAEQEEHLYYTRIVNSAEVSGAVMAGPASDPGVGRKLSR